MASNFFDKVIDDAKSMEKKLLGPDYPYYSYVATPAELGMSESGSLSATANNIAAMLNYIQLMVEGTIMADRKLSGNLFLENHFEHEIVRLLFIIRP